jgi:Tol biopolymer transport system component
MKIVSSLFALLPTLLLAALPLAGATPQSASGRATKVTGPYFGQNPPGRTPELFAPGILSLPDRMEARLAFSPDGNECFFTSPVDFKFSKVQMYYTKRINNVWTPQVLAPFFPGYSCRQPFFSADGNKLYFSSNKNGASDIWVVERTSQGWGTPQVLPPPINSASGAGEYSQTTDGTAYFESNRPGSLGTCDVWRARSPRPVQPLQVENLGAPINSGTHDGDPFIAPDGKYLIFASYRPGGCGNADLYVSFSNKNGGWTEPVNLNQYCPGVNTGAIEYGASLSPDERYLFYAHLDPDARQCDVYWVENPFFKNQANPIVDSTDARPAGMRLEWTQFIGGSGGENLGWLHAPLLDRDGMLWFAGATTSSDFPTTADAFDRTYNGGTPYWGGDVFLMQLSADLKTVKLATLFGGAVDDYSPRIATVPGGDFFVFGDTTSKDLSVTAEAAEKTMESERAPFLRAVVPLPTRTVRHHQYPSEPGEVVPASEHHFHARCQARGHQEGGGLDDA